MSKSVESPGGSAVKTLPALQETWVQFLGWEHSLKEEMATHCSLLAWEISQIKEPRGLQRALVGSRRVGHD